METKCAPSPSISVYNAAMPGPDLETRILNRLQEHSQTLAQLKTALKETRESILLMALHNLRKSGQITQSKGVWTLVRPL